MRDTPRGSLLLLLVCLAGAASPLRAASVPPDLHFQTLIGHHASVHFHQGLEDQARVAVAVADGVLPRLEQRYATHLGRVQIVLVDDNDDANGFTYVFPYPAVRINLAAPDGSDEFGAYESWLRLVLTHELTHAVHLNEARGLAGLGRRVFGRAPFTFPNSATPTWLVEGLATYEETRMTAYGRGRNPDTRMVLRMAALAGRWPGEDQAVAGLDRWPDGYAPYLFGESFLQDLTARFGDDTLPRLAARHAAWPAPFLDELTSLKVTGATFNHRWREWSRAQREMARQRAREEQRQGITPTTALTRRGIRQIAPRVSPDGRQIAYLSSSLERQRQIRLMEIDGHGDHGLREVSGGTGLAWTPDGRRVIYDQSDFYRTYRWWSDLYALDVASGSVERLTHGLRASQPDVSPDGKGVVFVHRTASGTEIAWLDLPSGATHDLTSSPAGTVWSAPRVHPSGATVVAARLSPGGWLDLAIIDVSSGCIDELTHDRARDAEPTWSADGHHVIFRSDRDGTSNLWSYDVAAGTLRRLTRLLGGAFAPDAAPDGSRVVFSQYSADGYDLASAALQEGALAEPYVDPYPPPQPDPAASTAAAAPYRAWRELWPRYWSPFVSSLSDNPRIGVATSGMDPLFRHVWVARAFHSTETHRPGAEIYYAYDRFRPTVSIAGSVYTDPLSKGSLTTREVATQISLPLERSWKRSQAVSLTLKRQDQRSRGTANDSTVSLGSIEAAWRLGTARQYPFTVSPIDGGSLRVAVTREASWLGSSFDLSKLTADARAYLRLGGSTQVIALRAGGGTTIGEKRLTSTFAVGGFPTGSLIDLLGTAPAVLRGYEEQAFSGRHLLYANVEYRFALFHPQRGLWTVPVFLRHLHGAAFVDAGHAWTGRLAARDVKTSVGVAVGADTYLGHAFPLTGVVGIARGLDARGITELYARAGLAF